MSQSYRHPGRGGPWRRFFSQRDAQAGIGDLLSISDSKMDLHERTLWLERILRWLKKTDGRTSSEARFRHFFNLLEQNPEWKKSFQASLTTLLAQCSFLKFFLNTGYTNEHGLWGEVWYRLLERVLPGSARGDVQEIIIHVFKDEADFEWLEHLPPSLLARVSDLVASSITPEVSRRIASDLREALLILSTNVAHHGISIAVRGRHGSSGAVSESAFLELSVALQRFLLESMVLFHSSDHDEVRLKVQIERCRRDLDAVYDRIEESGVSVATVHRLEALTAAIARVETLLEFERRRAESERLQGWVVFLGEVARCGLEGRSIRSHLSRHFYLLSRKIAERNGHSGEHYIARSGEDLREMFRSAFGGGVIVVGMALLKIMVAQTGLAPVFMATAVWIIYSAGFLTMQFTDCTLATKIPSFAASRLAQWIKDARSRNDTHLFTDEVKAVVKSQSVALLGNVASVVPIAWGLGMLAIWNFGHPVWMSPEYAAYTLQAIHPISAVFLGLVTGVQLWASSICGGWFENFAVFMGIPDAIAKHPRLRRIFGEEKAKKFSEFFLNHASGVATNISLGFFFGFVPLFGALFGLNLEGKHVTISTASAAFSVSALGPAVVGREIAIVALGLFVIGVMNFLGSFVLALVVAARAQNVRKAWAMHFLRSILWKSEGQAPLNPGK